MLAILERWIWELTGDLCGSLTKAGSEADGSLLLPMLLLAVLWAGMMRFSLKKEKQTYETLGPGLAMAAVDLALNDGPARGWSRKERPKRKSL